MSIRKSLAPFNCSLARTADLIGDGWSMLILRDLFLGARHFGEFAASTGMARNILAQRLKHLAAAGLILREGPTNRPLYSLTDQGYDLVPALLALIQWGDRWLSDGKPPMILRDHKGRKLPAITLRSRKDKKLDPRQVRVQPGPGADDRTTAWLKGLNAD
jgi:DNA-binding HxlR family transcriptional regulator